MKKKTTRAKKKSRKTAKTKSRKKSELKAPKRRRFVAGLIDGKSMRAAALDAGYTESMADNAGAKILPGAQAEFREELSKTIPLGKLLARIAEGLDAKDTEFAKFEGAISDSQDVVAWGERRASAELIARLMGWVKERVEITGKDGGKIEINVTSAREKLIAQLGGEVPQPEPGGAEETGSEAQ